MATNVPTTGDLLEVPSGVARLRYFYGQLLTQRDLQAEQGYHLLLQRLMQRETFGTGTLAGLRVDAVGASAPESVIVRAGLGFDPDGRELLLVNDVSIKIADPPLSAATHQSSPTSNSSTHIASWLTSIWANAGISITVAASDIEALSGLLTSIGLTGDTGGAYPTTSAQVQKLAVPSTAPTGPLSIYLFNALVGTTHVGLRYAERGKEPAPSVLDGSCCGEAACFPSRAEEGVVVVAASTPFPAISDPHREAFNFLFQCLTEKKNAQQQSFSPPAAMRDCLAAYVTNTTPATFRGLPPSDGVCGPAAAPVVPLAIAFWSRFSVTGQSRILFVDNALARPIAVGVHTFRALFEAATQVFT